MSDCGQLLSVHNRTDLTPTDLTAANSTIWTDAFSYGWGCAEASFLCAEASFLCLTMLACVVG